MPMRPPRICGCGRVVPGGVACECQKRRRALIDRNRPSARARGYDSKWDKARRAFLDANPHCSVCHNPATVVDHKIPHRGDMKLFWSRANWQPLCATHHNSWKQSLEKRKVNE